MFYSIGEFVTRKGWGTLLRAYLTEFDRTESVRLVIKTSLPGHTKEQTQQKVGEYIQAVANGLKLTNLPTVCVLTEYQSEEDLLKLHSTCDCFVTASYAEAACLPAMEALASGKTPIVPNSSGFKEWANEEVAYLVPTREEPCFGVYDTFEDLYTGRENWWVPDQLALQKAMRIAFTQSAFRRSKALSGIKHSYTFSHESVGAVLERALHERAQMAGLA
jgi:glycosyltransferase involved in cell wall biosynthesis